VKTRQNYRSFIFPKTINRSEEGGALVEMAVTLPLLMMIMTGIFSFSIAIYQKLQLAEAVSNGGHYLAVDRGDADPCKTVANAIYSSAPGLNQNSISLTFTINGVPTGPTCPGASGAANADMVSGGNAEILASYPCALSVYGANFTSCNLQSDITEVVQ